MSEQTTETVQTPEEETAQTQTEQTQTEQTQTEQTESAPESAAPAITLESLDDFGQAFVKRTISQIEKYNALTTDIKASSTDPQTVADALLEQARNLNLPENVAAEIRKAAEAYDKAMKVVIDAETRLKVWAQEEGTKKAEAAKDDEHLKAITTERDDLKNRIDKGRKHLAAEYGDAALTLLPDMQRSVGGSTGDGKGKGGRKLRGFTVTVNGTVATLPNQDGQQVSSFAAGAKVLGIPTADFQRAYMAAVGTENAEDFPPVANFTVKNKDGQDCEVKAEKNAE